MLSFFFFFKQKTAYEMRISDWSSDVCSSDLSRSPKANRRAASAARLASAQAPATYAVSILIPGPIDELIATFWTYLPLAPVGLALTTASTSASKFARRSAAGKLALPMPDWMIPAFSTPYSTCPPLAAFTAAATAPVETTRQGEVGV